MTTILPFNFKKPTEYEFYHVRIFNSNSITSDCFDLSFEEAKIMINKIKGNCDYIVIGTIDNIDNCLNYINNCQNIDNGLIGCYLSKKEIFTSTDTIFVNCTEYFKHIYLEIITSHIKAIGVLPMA